MNYLTRKPDPTLKRTTWFIGAIWAATTIIVLMLPNTPHKPVINPIGGEKQYYPVNGYLPGTNYVHSEIKK